MVLRGVGGKNGGLDILRLNVNVHVVTPTALCLLTCQASE